MMSFERHQYTCVLRVSRNTGIFGRSGLVCGRRERKCHCPVPTERTCHLFSGGFCKQSERVKLALYRASFKGKWQPLTLLRLLSGTSELLSLLIWCSLASAGFTRTSAVLGTSLLGTMKAPGFQKTLRSTGHSRHWKPFLTYEIPALGF